MKLEKLFLVILLFLSFSVLYSEDSISYMQLSTDFKGVVHHDSTVIAYGTGSVIMSSTDLGNTWKQDQIGTMVNDICRIRYNGLFYGVMGNNLIKSSNGMKWDCVILDSCSIGDDILLYNDSLYVLNSSGKGQWINIYDKELKLIKRITTNSTTTSGGELLIFDNHIIVTNKRVKLLKLDINNDFAIDTIDFKSLHPMTGKSVKQFRIDGDYCYVLVDSLLFRTNDLKKQWEFVADSVNDYCISEHKIYRMNTPCNKWRNMQSLIEFGVLGNNGKFNTICAKENERFLRYVAVSELCFINSTTIIAVGEDKFIAISYDSGERWKIVNKLSQGSSHSYISWGKNNEVICDGVYGEIFKSNDEGITWQSTKFTDTLNSLTLVDTNSIGEVNLIGYGMSSGADYILQKDKNIYMVGFSGVSNEPNILRSYDKGDSYYPELDPVACFKNVKHKPAFMNNQYYFLSQQAKFLKYPNISHVLVFDENLYGIKSIRIDSIFIEAPFYSKSDNKLYAIQKNDTDTNFRLQYSVASPDNDSLTRWSNVVEILTIPKLDTNNSYDLYYYYNENNNYLDVIQHSENWEENIFKIVMDRWNISTKQLICSVLIDSSNTRISINSPYITDGKKAYIYASHALFINDDIVNTPSLWRKVGNPIGELYSPYNSEIVNGTFYGYTDNLIRIKFENSTGIDYATEKRDYLYSFPAYPNPAKEYVKSRIYWDASADINDARINVYNSMGERVAGKNDVEFERLDEYSGELSWNCAGMPVGTYLIQVEHGNTSQTIRLVVER